MNHQKLVRGRFPKSRGIKIGTVVGTGRGVRVELCEAFDDLVKPGDGVLFDIGTPEAKEPGGRVWEVKKAQGRPSLEMPTVELSFEHSTLDLAAIPLGCDVYRTDDPALRKRLEHSYSQDLIARPAILSARLTGQVGGALSLTFTDDDGVTGSATWPGPLELARQRSNTYDEIREQLYRLGGTPFVLDDIDIEDLSAKVMPSPQRAERSATASGERSGGAPRGTQTPSC